MTESKHTPGPWTVDHPHIRASATAPRNEGRDHAIARICTRRKVFATGEAIANAARIVSCVNACEGIEDPAAEIERLRAREKGLEERLNWQVDNEVRMLDERTATLRAECDRLRAACEALVAKVDLVVADVAGPLAMEAIHGRPYTGAKVEPELSAARATLSPREGK